MHHPLSPYAEIRLYDNSYRKLYLEQVAVSDAFESEWPVVWPLFFLPGGVKGVQSYPTLKKWVNEWLKVRQLGRRHWVFKELFKEHEACGSKEQETFSTEAAEGLKISLNSALIITHNQLKAHSNDASETAWLALSCTSALWDGLPVCLLQWSSRWRHGSGSFSWKVRPEELWDYPSIPGNTVTPISQGAGASSGG